LRPYTVSLSAHINNTQVLDYGVGCSYVFPNLDIPTVPRQVVIEYPQVSIGERIDKLYRFQILPITSQ
jgi:hypothetical protein